MRATLEVVRTLYHLSRFGDGKSLAIRLLSRKRRNLAKMMDLLLPQDVSLELYWPDHGNRGESSLS